MANAIVTRFLRQIYLKLKKKKKKTLMVSNISYTNYASRIKRRNACYK